MVDAEGLVGRMASGDRARRKECDSVVCLRMDPARLLRVDQGTSRAALNVTLSKAVPLRLWASDAPSPRLVLCCHGWHLLLHNDRMRACNAMLLQYSMASYPPQSDAS